MVLTRVISKDEWNEVLANPKALARIKILFWRDPATDDILKAFSHEGKVCPVILAWRKLVDLSINKKAA